MPKTIFITGASSGIGRATAEYFSAQGWNVAATMRKPTADTTLRTLPKGQLFRLDVLDEISINEAINATHQSFGNIDVLLNNAGYAATGPFEAATPDQVNKQFDTNVFGLMNVTRAILPHFRNTKSGVIINVASVGGRVTFPLYSLYHSTKWAVEGFSESLQYELRSLGIRVKIIEPGPIKTDFYDRSMDVLQKVGLTAYDSYCKNTMRNMNEVVYNASGPTIVAKVIFKAATDGSYKLRYPVGGNAPLLLMLRRLIPESWFYAIVRKVVERK